MATILLNGHAGGGAGFAAWKSLEAEIRKRLGKFEIISIEYMAHHMHIMEKYRELLETDHEKYTEEFYEAMEELPRRMGVTDEAINAYTESATDDVEGYMEIVDRIHKRAQELSDEDK